MLIQGECVIGCAKTAEPNELPYRLMSGNGIGPRNSALDGRAH